MLELVVGFDWDLANLAKCQKHGVSVKEIEDIFTRKFKLYSDEKHSFIESRYIAIGSSGDRTIFIAFTLREYEERLLIRVITARYMHRKEVLRYEKTLTKI